MIYMRYRNRVKSLYPKLFPTFKNGFYTQSSRGDLCGEDLKNSKSDLRKNTTKNTVI